MAAPTLQRRPLVKQILAGADDDLLVIAGLDPVTRPPAGLGKRRRAVAHRPQIGDDVGASFLAVFISRSSTW